MRTANAWNYAYAVSRVVPDRLHKKILRIVQSERREEDSFPTLYRCNTRGQMIRSLKKAGLEPVVVLWEAEPGYLGFSPLIYRLGLAWSRIAPASTRNTLLAFGIKPQAKAVVGRVRHACAESPEYSH
jgi:hypothetical protein